MNPGIMLFMGCKVDIYEQIQVLKDIGIRHTFLNAGHPELDKIISLLKKDGITCDNLHAEFNGKLCSDIFTMEDICRPGISGDKMLNRILRNIDKCATHGIPVLVVHSPHESPEISINEYTKERYTAIGNYAREKKVKIAFENIKYTQNLEYVMSLVPDAGFCWDCGHQYCLLKDEPPMPFFSKRLAALHLHDNFIDRDDHLIPFTGKIDFNLVCKQLAESGFDGTIMLELLYGYGAGNSTEATYRDYAVKAKSAAEKIIDIIEKQRQ